MKKSNIYRVQQISLYKHRGLCDTVLAFVVLV